MLINRILTSIMLVLVLLISFKNYYFFAILLTLTFSLLLIEWLSLTIYNNHNYDIHIFIISILLMFYIFYCFEKNNILVPLIYNFVIPLVVLIWLFIITPYILYIIISKKKYKLNLFWSFFALPACVSAWFSIIYFYQQFGGFFIVTLFSVVWSVDILAYFIGKLFGGYNITYNISPNKTISGYISGILGSIICIYIHTFFNGSFGFFLFEKYSLKITLIIAVFLGFISIIGDLFESLLKRCKDCKDSGKLLPGHGGIYDRLDSILPIAPIAIILCGV
ncbi:Phosphatidate cytidylyltransferase [Candidatus Kinetoplastibacterium sorsogonicusi]|uniref:Phosphatidate cytidylyltransferase n=1 Tax=Candidatus Kinetoplastidibacterium kentomonadis TaxID=1576550 RepID=A0A3S7J9U1_9PROT|nr:phosphatidate cytidylyltransferase [Candidatus Kinetoplastibacterium sorsogonicusi]AWD32429.1 Phosphatidate cytidylyltransferase [Candidatus Kinetoplastibacterium sorsogonicusi]